MNLEQRHVGSVSALCSLLGYSRQAYYQQAKSVERQALGEELVLQEVGRIRARQKRVGTRKLLKMLDPFLRQHGIQLGRDKLFELLASRGLLVRKRRRRVPRTTLSNRWQKPYPNLTIGLPVLRANALWVSDITYLTLADDFAYLSLITDAYSHRIVGYHLSKDLRATGCVKALKMALKTLPRDGELIHHSDRGCQYCSVAYVYALQSRRIAISTTQHSDPRENAIAERVNGILKQELLESVYENFNAARAGVAQAIGIYNNERLHSSVDLLTPLAAHHRTGTIKKHWKNYYKLKQEKEATMG